MFRNYEEYEKFFEEKVQSVNFDGKIKKRTPEEFARENYRDKVEWYLIEEWGTEAFHEIFFADCAFPEEDDDSDEMSPEEERAEELHGAVYDIIEVGRVLGMSINQTARQVYEYLSKEKAI